MSENKLKRTEMLHQESSFRALNSEQLNIICKIAKINKFSYIILPLTPKTIIFSILSIANYIHSQKNTQLQY